MRFAEKYFATSVLVFFAPLLFMGAATATQPPFKIIPLPEQLPAAGTRVLEASGVSNKSCPSGTIAAIRFIEKVSLESEQAMANGGTLPEQKDVDSGLALIPVYAAPRFALVVRRAEAKTPRDVISNLLTCTGLHGGTVSAARDLGLYASDDAVGALYFSPRLGMYALQR